jgi:hypothetical protein
LPIGVTAKGDVVFPMQCEALIHQPDPLSSSPAAQTVPPYGQSQALQPASSSLSSSAGEVGPSENAGANRTSAYARSNPDTRQSRSGKREQSTRSKSAEAVFSQGTDRSRERPMARSPRITHPAEPEWYNALGLR